MDNGRGAVFGEDDMQGLQIIDDAWVPRELGLWFLSGDGAYLAGVRRRAGVRFRRVSYIRQWGRGRSASLWWRVSSDACGSIWRRNTVAHGLDSGQPPRAARLE